MGTTHAVVTLPSVSGFPEDSIVNTFTIGTPLAVSTDPGDITTALTFFYNGAAANQDNPLAWYLSAQVSRAALGSKIALYNVTNHLDGSPHGPPYFEDSFTLGAANSNAVLPTEVALVATLLGQGRGDVSPEVPDDADPSGVNDPGIERDRPMQRRTGRIYLGPLGLAGYDSGDGRPTLLSRQDILDAMTGLNTALLGRPSGPYRLVVWSRANAATYPVQSCFVDNAYDTQRRRGLRPTVRLTQAT